MKLFIIFFVLQLINVMLNTVKTLVMAKFNSVHLSAMMNAVAFGFYTIVVKQIAELPLNVTIIVTVITNIIGVYLSYLILNKLKRDSLWKVECYFPKADDCTEYQRVLTGSEIGFTVLTPQLINIYSYTQQQSHFIRTTLKHYNAKTNITVISAKF